MNHPQTRASIHFESATVLQHQAWPGEQRILRLAAARCAANAKPGQFIHLKIDTNSHAAPQLRRPISIQRVNREQGWIELLYKIVGSGTAQLAELREGQQTDLLGPIGKPFQIDPERHRPLLIGGGVGMPPMIFLADAIQAQHPGHQAFAILGSEVPFPFTPDTHSAPIDGIPDSTHASCPWLNATDTPNRLASLQASEGDFSGCHSGYVTELARQWLDAQSPAQHQQITLYSCGPHPMLQAVAQLAHDYQLPAQISLEEYMACAVGGCAGCTVQLQTEHGPAMKRVCVDGPVFDAQQVFPQ